MFDTTNQFGLTLLINDNPLTEYQHQGMAFVEGRTNSNYELKISNNSYERIMAIPSVDGLSVIDGKTAGIDSPGYVLEPYQTLSIPGWKVDGDTAAKFQFGSASGSYSNRTNRGKKNVGVVGLMVFRPKPVINNFTFTSAVDNSGLYGWNNATLLGGSVGSSDTSKSLLRSAAPSGGGTTSMVTSNMMSSQNLGTEFGDSTTFSTTETVFEKRDPNYPDALISIFYDDANGLEARGIILPYRNSSPQAFPSYTSSTQYAPPPSDWRK